MPLVLKPVGVNDTRTKPRHPGQPARRAHARRTGDLLTRVIGEQERSQEDKMNSIRRLIWGTGVCSMALLAAGGAWAHDDDDDDHHNNKPTTRHMTGKLEICDFGSFFVGG